MVADAEHFFQGRNALAGLVDAVFEQGAHAEQAGLAADRLGRLAIESHFADGGIELQKLEDAIAAAITGMMAIIAAPAAHERGGGCALWRNAGGIQFGGGWLVWLLAFWA